MASNILREKPLALEVIYKGASHTGISLTLRYWALISDVFFAYKEASTCLIMYAMRSHPLAGTGGQFEPDWCFSGGRCMLAG